MVLADVGPYGLVVCGGAALISCGMVSRTTTQDVDIVAMMNMGADFVSPDPLPEGLLRIAFQVAEDLDLPEIWLNNGPSRDPGGLYQVGLPEGIGDRLTRRDYGKRLTVYYVNRIDQIYFKVFASVDSGPGRHVDDLMELRPSPNEIEKAALWAMTHDQSAGFRMVLVSMLHQMGFKDVAERI
ncbi:MAG: hypothetical protein ABFS43_14745 [Thermodesulfobacteriota bacterium]